MSFFDSSVSKLYVAEYDVTPFTTEISLPTGRPVRSVTTLADAGEMSIPGTHNSQGSWSGLHDVHASNDNWDKIISEVKAAAAPGDPLSYWPKGTALGVQGEVAAIQIPDESRRTSVGNVVEASAVLQVDGKVYRAKALTKQTVSATTLGTSIDGLAATTDGAAFIYHVEAITGQWQIDLEDSADDAAFATVSGMASGSITVRESKLIVSAAGTTLRRYVRLSLTEDVAGSITIIAGFVRNLTTS